MLLNGRQRTDQGWKQNNRVDNFLSKNKMPKKDSIIVFSARKGEDILFMDNISIIDEKIFMKLSDIK